MNADQINKQFEELLATGAEGSKTRKAIGMSAEAAATYRNYINRGQPITLELKMKWLQKAGIPVHAPAAFTKADLVALINYYNSRASKSAKVLGAEYVVEKFLKARSNPMR